MKTSEKIKFEKFFPSHRIRLYKIIVPLQCEKEFLGGEMLNQKEFNFALLLPVVAGLPDGSHNTYGHMRSNSSLLSTKLNSEVAVRALICFEH